MTHAAASQSLALLPFVTAARGGNRQCFVPARRQADKKGAMLVSRNVVQRGRGRVELNLWIVSDLVCREMLVARRLEIATWDLTCAIPDQV